MPAIGSCEVFIGLTVDAGIRDEHLRHVRFKSTSGGGTGRRYLRNGSVDIIPMHLSDVPKVIRDGKLRIDVLLAGVSPHEENGCVSLGVITDLLPAALERARIVIGVAELRGQTLRERMAAMANLSHPKFREELLRASRSGAD